MILYHFTCIEHLESILAEGLNRGEAPLSATTFDVAVNLTSSPTPAGLGLEGGGRFVADDEARRLGVPLNSFFPDKQRVRISLRVSSGDKALVPWSKWSAKQKRNGRADPVALGNMERDQRPRTWFLYFGTLSPDRFVEVLDTMTGKPLVEREAIPALMS